jgi:hypothetical protein
VKKLLQMEGICNSFFIATGNCYAKDAQLADILSVFDNRQKKMRNKE